MLEVDTDGDHMMIDRQFASMPEFRSVFDFDRFIVEMLTTAVPDIGTRVLVSTYDQTYAAFTWRVPEYVNFTNDVIDCFAEDRSRTALYWEDESGRTAQYTFWDLSRASSRLANALRGLGVGRGDPVLVMLPRIPEWQIAVLAVLRLGALLIPCTTSLRVKDIRYRAGHSGARALITTAANIEVAEAARGDCPDLTIAVCVGGMAPGWHQFEALLAGAAPHMEPVRSRADEPAIVFYTSGTTKEPKAVLHTHAYTYAHRYTGRYWLDVRPEDLHWTTSDTGWAKAAYGVLYGPWHTGTPVLMYNGRFEPQKELELLERYEVSVFCAPPTEYRMLVKEDLSRYRLPKLRHCTGAGEPLNPEVIHAVARSVRPYDPRRVRSNREHAARRQSPGNGDSSRVDGQALPWT